MNFKGVNFNNTREDNNLFGPAIITGLCNKAGIPEIIIGGTAVVDGIRTVNLFAI